MKTSYARFGGFCAIVTGFLSILYAVFYLFVTKQSEFTGSFGAWLILGISGIFSSAVYVALYEQVKKDNEGFALWAFLLGVLSSFATALHGIQQALVTNLLQSATGAARDALLTAGSGLSQVDPAGFATFFVDGLVLFLFGCLILRTRTLARPLGYIAWVNAILLIILFAATVVGSTTLILISGGLSSVIVGPIWWIWLGLQLRHSSVKSIMTNPTIRTAVF